jgi:phosphatidylglycerophosphatase C
MTMMFRERPVVAAFDFDGTLTYTDTLLPFLHTVVGTFRWLRYLAELTPTLVAYQGGRLSNEVAKQQFLVRFLQGQDFADLEATGQRFAQRTLPYFLRRRALRCLAWHRERQHRCVLVSASLELYLRPWAESVGFAAVLGSRLERASSGLVTGRLVGKNCYGEEKARRLAELLGDRGGYCLYAYGDSGGDRALLNSADYAYYRCFPKETGSR